MCYFDLFKTCWGFDFSVLTCTFFTYKLLYNKFENEIISSWSYKLLRTIELEGWIAQLTLHLTFLDKKTTTTTTQFCGKTPSLDLMKYEIKSTATSADQLSFQHSSVNFRQEDCSAQNYLWPAKINIAHVVTLQFTVSFSLIMCGLYMYHSAIICFCSAISITRFIQTHLCIAQLSVCVVLPSLQFYVINYQAH